MKTLSYKSPAKTFGEAIPVGNGRIGATLFGETGRETIFLNEESVWSGRYIDRNNKDAFLAIKKIRSLLAQGQEDEAQEEAFECLTGTPSEQTFYKSAGKISIDFYDAEHKGLLEPESGKKNVFSSFDSYRREIDFSSGITTTTFSVESSAPSTAYFSRGTTGSYITFTRECFVSSASNVIVFHASASTPKSIFLRLKIEKENLAKKYTLTEDTLVALDISGIPFAIMATAVASGGTVFTRGDNLIVEGADDVTLYIDVETAYRKVHYRKKGGNVFRNQLTYATKCADIALKRICFASGTSYENLKAEHIAEFDSWNQNCTLSLGGKENENQFFEEIIKNKKEEKVLEWDWAKYSLISSCKDCATLPSIEKGLWSDRNDSGRFNLKDKSLYRYCAGVLGLEQINLPLFTFAKRIVKNGKVTAQRMYGTLGFVSHSSTDIWGDTVPEGTDLRTSFTPLGAVCLAQAIIDYYEYSLDKKFLKKHLYIIKEACRFFIDYLVSLEEKNSLALSPAFSSGKKVGDKTLYIIPENKTNNVALKKLFTCMIDAIKYLGFNTTGSLYLKYNSILQKIKDGKEEKPQVENQNFSDFILSTVTSIISSEMKNDTIEISLLSNPPEEWPEGELKKVRLKGNIFADVKWHNGKFESTKLYVEPGTSFIKKINIYYNGKKYDAQFSDSTLDVKNVLPTTI